MRWDFYLGMCYSAYVSRSGTECKLIWACVSERECIRESAKEKRIERRMTKRLHDGRYVWNEWMR